MGYVPNLVRDATDAQHRGDARWVPGSRRATEQYRQEYERGLRIAAQSWPAIVQGQVQAAIEGNPLCAKWVRDTLNWTPPKELSVKTEQTKRVELVVLGPSGVEERLRLSSPGHSASPQPLAPGTVSSTVDGELVSGSGDV